MKKLTVFHPSPNLVELIDNLILKNNPNLKYKNIVEPELLNQAIENGITDDVRNSVKNIIHSVSNDNPHLVLCTCSTIGGIAEEIGKELNRNVVRIDRAMGEKAVETGNIIGVAAALESTIDPTLDMLTSIAQQKNKTVEFKIIHCPKAWQYKINKDDENYIKQIEIDLRPQLEGLDVLILAQGSMVPVTTLLSDINTPILTSPELGVEQALEMIHED